MTLQVLVYGAPGVQGTAVVQRLLSNGHKVRVLTPAGQDTSALESLGAERAVGDFADSDSLAKANEGVDAVSLVLPLDYDAARVTGYGERALKAAAGAGVKHLVFNTSTQYPALPTSINLHDIKIALQDIIMSGPVPATILRPTIYLGNILSPFSAPAIVNDGIFAYPLPAEHAVSWISWDDMASFVAGAIIRPELAGSVFDISGPNAVTGTEFAEIIAQVIGRPVQYMALPIPAFANGLNQAIGAPAGDEIARFYEWFASQPRETLAIDPGAALAAIPIHLTTIAEWVAQQDWSSWKK